MLLQLVQVEKLVFQSLLLPQVRVNYLNLLLGFGNLRSFERSQVRDVLLFEILQSDTGGRIHPVAQRV